MFRRVLIFLALIFSVQVGFAQTDNASIYRFLELTPTARASALGGNHVGLLEADFSMFNLNPAYLKQNSGGKVSATFVNYLSDARIGITNTAWNIKDIGTLGIGIRYVGYGDLDHLDENGTNMGSFNASDIAFSAALSTPLSHKITAGGGIDFIRSSYYTYKSSAIAVSGGLFYQDTAHQFSFGLAIRNLGTQLSYFDNTREDLPLDISVGITKKPEHFPFQLSLTLRQLNNWDMEIFGENGSPSFTDNLMRHVLLGAETALSENFKFRLGYNHLLHEQTKTGNNFDLAGVGFGVGFKVKTLFIDISRNSYSDLGGIFRMGVSSQLK